MYEHLKSTAKELPDNVDEMQPLYGCWAGKPQEALDGRAHLLLAQTSGGDEATRIAARSGMLLHQTDAHLGFAHYHLAQDQPAEAKTHLDKARTLIAKTGYHRRDAALQALSQELDARLARESSAGG